MMSRRMLIFILILVLNLVITILYLVFCHIKERKFSPGIWMKAAVMLLCPVIGPLFLFLSWLLFRLFMGQAMDLDDVIFNKERKEIFLRPDEDVERNLVSVEEALAVTDKKNLRRLIMNVLRGDYRESLSSIALALNSEDSETSHYSASVLQDVLNDFRVNVEKRYQECMKELPETEDTEEKEDCVRACIELMRYMNLILEQKVFTDIEQRSMVQKMNDVCERAWNLDREKIDSACFEMISLRLLELKEFVRCEIWCDRAMSQCPETLASYTCQLKLYFSSGQREKFFYTMDLLKQSDIVIDNETLELIRTFM